MDEAGGRDSKVTGTIVHILFPEQVAHLKKLACWVISTLEFARLRHSRVQMCMTADFSETLYSQKDFRATPRNLRRA